MRSGYRDPALDGVRGLAVLLVFVHHVHAVLIPAGYVGVDLFFVLSGFLITSILLDEYRRVGTIHLGAFYLRRFLRLYPALASVVVFTILYSLILGGHGNVRYTIADGWRVLLYYFNWHLIWSLPNIEGPDRFSHLWSLSIEEQFYVVWPLLLLTLLACGIKNRIMWLLLLAAIVGPAIARVLVWYGLLFWDSTWWPQWRSLWIYMRTDLRIDSLMWGASVAWLLHCQYAPSERARRVIGWGGLLGLVGLVCYALLYDGFASGGYQRAGVSVVGLLSALLLAGVVWSEHPLLRRLLEPRWLTWLGGISYGLYLWHMPVISISDRYGLSGPLRTIFVVPLSLAIASLSYYKMELPILRLKDRIGHDPEAIRQFFQQIIISFSKRIELGRSKEDHPRA